MVRGKKRAVGGQIGWVLTAIHKSLTGQIIQPYRFDPYHDHTKPVKVVKKEETEAEREYRINRNWRILDRYFEKVVR